MRGVSRRGVAGDIYGLCFGFGIALGLSRPAVVGLFVPVSALCISLPEPALTLLQLDLEPISPSLSVLF